MMTKNKKKSQGDFDHDDENYEEFLIQVLGLLVL